MAGRKKRQDVRETDLAGFKFLEELAPLLAGLHNAQCQRDRANNRNLHMDQYCMLIFLFLFNPIVDSLRALQQASKLSKLHQRLGIPQTSLGSLSEAARVFDADQLLPLIEKLKSRLQSLPQDPRLHEVRRMLTLVDGSLISTLPCMAEAMLLKDDTGSGMIKWRLHTQFELLHGVPERIDVTRNGGGDCDERAVLGRTVQADRTYVMDRGYAKFALFNQNWHSSTSANPIRNKSGVIASRWTCSTSSCSWRCS